MIIKSASKSRSSRSRVCEYSIGFKVVDCGKEKLGEN